MIETKYRTLEETAALFDGDSALEVISGKAAHEVAAGPTDIREDVDEKHSVSDEPPVLSKA